MNDVRKFGFLYENIIMQPADKVSDALAVQPVLACADRDCAGYPSTGRHRWMTSRTANRCNGVSKVNGNA